MRHSHRVLTPLTHCHSKAAGTQMVGRDVQIVDGRTRIFQVCGQIADLHTVDEKLQTWILIFDGYWVIFIT